MTRQAIEHPAVMNGRRFAATAPASVPEWDQAPAVLYEAGEPHYGYFFLKRLIDLVGGICLLVAGFPILILSAVAVLLTSGWPIFFGQRRLGLGGGEFICWKFRTMTRDAERRRDEVLHLNTTNGPTFKHPRDPRVTTVGVFLRRTSIDEIPQLWNVLAGTMSLVGPRPLPLIENKYQGDQVLRLSVKPGLTCTWQVSGRSNISFDQWMEMDLEYIRTRSIGQDLRLIARTVLAVLSLKGAM